MALRLQMHKGRARAYCAKMRLNLGCAWRFSESQQHHWLAQLVWRRNETQVRNYEQVL
jgi:hypothetical protein